MQPVKEYVTDVALGARTAKISLRDDGTSEARIESDCGDITVLCSPTGDFSLVTPDGDLILPSKQGALEYGDLRLSVASEQLCGG